uniref:Copper transport protein n=1 Tax=Ciona intestinalis TaxID=7719 RepID=F6QAV6_CIOIN|nr:probable low affinity copper uptake protein 2 [Ciona intestinalis]|eukprot:XP_002128630.1 probable low affinity copper uptake protein 2 [Ciona intestinalis]
MEEYFSWWNLPLEFLFDAWKISNAVGLLFTCIAVFCVALIFEGFRILSAILSSRFFVLPLVPCNRDDDSSSSSINGSVEITDSLNHVKWERTKNHILQTAIHVFKVAASYGLMLAVMSYNAYIAISVLLGATLGYFVFCHHVYKLPRRTGDPCNLSRTTTCTFPEPSSEELLAGSTTAYIH